MTRSVWVKSRNVQKLNLTVSLFNFDRNKSISPIKFAAKFA